MFIPNDYFRFIEIASLAEGTDVNYRTEYSRDYARVLHSPSFRRLGNKTQLFPGQESDFFRNRLTHSLEVSQIAKSIACKLKAQNPDLPVIPEVCEIAGLVHDIGHPPFGHNGEAALDECMREKGGFEGNAQTIRILTRLEKKEKPDSIIDSSGKDCRVGLNLTARVIASALKYDNKIAVVREPDSELQKGYYESESEIVDKIKSCLVENPNELSKKFKTIECSIMDIADDIAYSTYDVEDAFKAEFLTPYDMLTADDSIYEEITKKLKNNNIDVSIQECRESLYGVFAEIWSGSIEQQKKIKVNKRYEMKTLNNILSPYAISKQLANDGYKRTLLTSKMVNSFINGVKIKYDPQNPILSSVELDDETKLRVNVLKHFSYVALINSSRLKVAESRGHEIIQKMFTALNDNKGGILLPEDTKKLYNMSEDTVWRMRIICDFIAGMTDRYAMEFYGRLFSENPQTIFKPL